MEYKLQRFFIKKEKRDYFIGVDHINNSFRIMKNDYSARFKVGDDRYLYYFIVKKGIFSITINPVSDEQFLEYQERVS